MGDSTKPLRLEGFDYWDRQVRRWNLGRMCGMSSIVTTLEVVFIDY